MFPHFWRRTMRTINITVLGLICTTLLLSTSAVFAGDKSTGLNSSSRLKVMRAKQQAFFADSKRNKPSVDLNDNDDGVETNVGVVNIEEGAQSPKDITIIVTGDVINVDK